MLILITGGSKSGKSKLAEQILASCEGTKVYLATMEPFGEEARAAIARHRQMRQGKGFQTVEQDTNLQEAVLPEAVEGILLECMGNLCANEMFSGKDVPEKAQQRIFKGVEWLQTRCETLVIVTNQVGEDGADYEAGTMEYIRVLGGINAALAKRADIVIEAVCGIGVCRKGKTKMERLGR